MPGAGRGEHKNKYGSMAFAMLPSSRRKRMRSDHGKEVGSRTSLVLFTFP